MSILKEQTAAILDRRYEYQVAEAYYEGDVPETFSTARLRRVFKTTGESGTLNFCRPVLNAVLNRLEISGFNGVDKRATDTLGRIWEQNDMAIEANEIHRNTLIYGDCYAMVWPDENGDLLISYNSPKTTAIVYDVENPRKKDYAVKMWEVKGGTRLNLYYPDRIEKYHTNTEDVTDGANWTLAEVVENPFGEIPVFHFRTHRPYGRPEHADAFDAQNYINKLFITNMYTIDYQGAPQRYALSQIGDNELTDYEEGDTDRENVAGLKNGPGELWYLKGIHTVGQFAPANPEVFWKPIKDTVRSLASFTDTPLHYFEATGNVPSGEALRVAEAPLMKKVRDRQTSLASAWRDLLRFCLRIEGIDSDVQVEWADVESMDSLDDWDVMLKKINAGLSHRQALREAGYDEEVIEKIMEERQEEAEAGSFYRRKPEVRATTTNDETHVEE